MMPGGFGTMDELMEVLTLVQTGKIRRLPIILVNSGYWKGLLDWIRGRMLADKMIGVDDPDLMQVIDDPQAVVDAIFNHYQARGFEPSPAEREAELARERGAAQDTGFGSQIRSYVLHPYQQVKDLRTSHEVGNAQGVLDGNLDGFIHAYLLAKAAGKAR
jgi:hypothetical protein